MSMSRHEYSRLRDIALGVILDKPMKFENNPLPNKFRMLHTKLLNTYRAPLLKLWRKGKGLLLLLKDVPVQIVESLHYSDPHRTPRPESKGGRTLICRLAQ